MSSDLLTSLQSSLGNAYAFERELGGGGMSRVFVATEMALRRRVVVKVLAPELAQGLSVERFQREIQLAAQGKATEAQRILDSARVTRSSAFELAAVLALALVSSERDDSAWAVVNRIVREPAASSVARERAARLGMTIAWRHGRLRDGTQMARYLLDSQIKRGVQRGPVDFALYQTMTDLLVREDLARAAQRIDSLAALGVVDSLPSEDRPDLELAIASALAGRSGIARKALARKEASQPWGTDNPLQHAIVRTLRGIVAMAEGRDSMAVSELRAAPTSHITFRDIAPYLGMAHDRVGRTDSAIVTFERALSEPTPDYEQGRYFGAIPFRLGELYEAKGDLRKAASAYARFIEAWKNADPELQPRVQEARKRLARLQQQIPG